MAESEHGGFHRVPYSLKPVKPTPEQQKAIDDSIDHFARVTGDVKFPYPILRKAMGIPQDAKAFLHMLWNDYRVFQAAVSSLQRKGKKGFYTEAIVCRFLSKSTQCSFLEIPKDLKFQLHLMTKADREIYSRLQESKKGMVIWLDVGHDGNYCCTTKQIFVNFVHQSSDAAYNKQAVMNADFFCAAKKALGGDSARHFLTWLTRRKRDLSNYSREEHIRIASEALQDYRTSPCRACGKAAKSACSRCKCARYCGPECQKIDWKKQHKKMCDLEKVDLDILVDISCGTMPGM